MHFALALSWHGNTPWHILLSIHPFYCQLFTHRKLFIWIVINRTWINHASCVAICKLSCFCLGFSSLPLGIQKEIIIHLLNQLNLRCMSQAIVKEMVSTFKWLYLDICHDCSQNVWIIFERGQTSLFFFCIYLGNQNSFWNAFSLPVHKFSSA